MVNLGLDTGINTKKLFPSKSLVDDKPSRLTSYAEKFKHIYNNPVAKKKFWQKAWSPFRRFYANLEAAQSQEQWDFKRKHEQVLEDSAKSTLTARQTSDPTSYYNAMLSSSDARDARDDVDSRRMKVMEVLNSTPEYSADFVNNQNLLKKLDKDYEVADQVRRKETEKLGQIADQKDLFEIARGPIGNYFDETETDEAKRFVADVFAPLSTDQDGNVLTKDEKEYNAIKIAERAISTYMGRIFDEVWKDAAGSGLLTKRGQLFQDPKVKNELLNLGKRVKESVIENFDDLIDEKGNIDNEKLLSLQVNDPKLQEVNLKMRDFIDQKESEYENAYWNERSKIHDGKSWVSRQTPAVLWDKVMTSAEWGKSHLREYFRDVEDKRRIKELHDPAKGNVFGITTLPIWEENEAWKMPRDAALAIMEYTNTKTGLDEFRDVITRDPLGNSMLAFDILATFYSGGAKGVTSAPQAIKNIQGLKNLNRVKMLNLGRGIGTEMIIGSELDSTINSITGDPNRGFDLVMNGLGGLLTKTPLGVVDNIMKNVLSRSNTEAQLVELNKYFKGFTEADLKDTEKLYDKITEKVSNMKAADIVLTYTESMKDAVKDIETVEGLTTIKDALKDIETSGIKIAETYENKIAKIESDIVKNNTEAAKQGVIDILDDISPEAYKKIMNAKINSNIKGNLFKDAYEAALSATGDKSAAFKVATEAAFGGEKTVDGVFKAIGKTDPNIVVNLTNKLDEVEKIINNSNDLKRVLDESDDLVKGVSDHSNVVANMQKSYDKLTDAQKSDNILLDSYKKDTEVAVRGLSSFDSGLYRNIHGNKMFKVRAIVGNMLDNMVNRKISDLNRPLVGIADSVYKSMPKQLKDNLDDFLGAGAKDKFNNLLVDFATGDSTKRSGIINKLNNNGVSGVSEILMDIDDTLTGMLDIVKLKNPLLDTDQIRSLYNISDVARDVGAKFDLEKVDKLDTITPLQKTLINGVGGVAQENYIPSLREVSNEISRNIANKSTPDIPASYFTADGMKLLNTVFEGVDGYSQEFMQRAFKKSQSRQKAIIDFLGNFIVNGKLVSKAKVGDRMMSLRDIIGNVDLKVTDSSLANANRITGGAIYSNGITLSKYLYLSDVEKLNGLMSSVIDDYFRVNSKGVLRGLTNDFVAKMEANSVGTAIIKLREDLITKLKSQGVSVSDANTITHPLFYNSIEYIFGTRGLKSIDEITDSVLDTLISRHKQLFHGQAAYDVLDDIQRNIPLEHKDKFVTYQGGTATINDYVNKLERKFWDRYIDDGMEFILDKGSFDQYRFVTGGYFTTKTHLGYVNNMTDAFKSDILTTAEIAGKTKPREELVGIVNELDNRLTELLKYSPNTGEISDIVNKVEDIKQYTKKAGVGDEYIDNMLDTFVDSYKANKEKAINSIYIDKMNKVVNNNKEVLIGDKKLSFDEIITTLDQNKKNKELVNQTNFNAQNTEFNRQVLNIDNLTTRGNPLFDIIASSGLSDEMADSLLKDLGLSASARKKVMGGAKRLSEKDVYSSMVKLLSEGKVSINEAISRNADFRNYMRKVFDEHGKDVDAAQFITLDKKGNAIIRDNQDVGSFFKSFGNLNLFAQRDKEVLDMLTRRNSNSRRKVFNPKFKKGKAATAENMNIQSYAYNARDEISKLVRDANPSFDAYKGMVDDVLNGNIFDAKKYTDKKMADLYKALWDYKEDITRFKGGILDISSADLMQGLDKLNLKKGFAQNAANRWTGQWVMFDDADINRLMKKFAVQSGAGKNRVLGNFSRDVLFGGLFDRKIGTGISNLMVQASMEMMFGPQAANKIIQQGVNNIFNARGKLAAFGMDGSKYDELAKYFQNKIGHSLVEGSARDVIRGADSGLNKKIAKGLQLTNSLVWADKLTKKAAQQGAMADAFYDMFELGGRKMVDDYLERFDDMDTFMKEYNLTESDFFNKDKILGHLESQAKLKNETMANILEQFDDNAAFYKSKVVPFQQKYRASIATFYATDNIPELSSIRVIDNNRMFFALKKWATTKFSEYGYKLSHDFKKYGAKGFMIRAAKGDLPIMNQIMSELYFGARLGWGVERLSGGDFDTEDMLVYMAVPATVLYMTFLDGIKSGRHTGSDAMRIKKEVKAKGGDVTDPYFGPIVMGVMEGVKDMFGTAFLHHNQLLSTFGQAYSTANVGDDIDKVPVFFQSLFKNIIAKPVNKFFQSQYAGYQFESDDDGKFETNLMEYLFNAQADPRKDQRRRISQLYMYDAVTKNSLGKFIQNWFSGMIPTGSRYAGTYRADVGLTQEMVNGYMQEKFDILRNPFGPKRDPEKFNLAMDEYNRIQLEYSMSNTSKGKEYLSKMNRLGQDLSQLPDEKIFNMAIKSGVVDANKPSKFFSDTVRALDGQLEMAKDVKSLSLATMSEEDQKALADNATELFDVYAKEGKQKTDNFYEKFIEASSDLGTNYVMADYLNAINMGLRKSLQKKYGIKDNEFKAGEGESLIFGAEVGQNEIDFINEFIALENEFVKDAWEYIGDNSSVTMSLQKQMISRDSESPVKNFSSKMENVFDYNAARDALDSDGYLSDNFMTAFNFHLRSAADRIRKTEDEVDKSNAYKAISAIAMGQVQALDEAVDQPYSNAMARMGLSYAISPFIDELSVYDKEGLQEVVDELGPDFVAMVDSVTSAAPLDVKTAFEYASGINTNPKKGSKKLPQAKTQEAKKNGNKLMNAYNKVNGFAKRLGDMGYKIAPVKAKYKISKGKYYEVEIDPVEIEIPEPPKTIVEVVPGESRRTKDLKAKTRSVKKSAFTGKFRPKKVKIAKSKVRRF